MLASHLARLALDVGGIFRVVRDLLGNIRGDLGQFRLPRENILPARFCSSEEFFERHPLGTVF